jgi:hypothetical protein
LTIEELEIIEQLQIKKIHDLYTESPIIPQHYDRIYDEYEKIHRKYVDFAIHNSDIEALKRAIFIQWYLVAEPDYLSGIQHLDESAELLALDELQRLASINKLDKEFIWMLRCYYEITMFFIPPESCYANLANYLENLPPWDPDYGKKYDFNNRGLMGNYWLSLLHIRNY